MLVPMNNYLTTYPTYPSLPTLSTYLAFLPTLQLPCDLPPLSTYLAYGSRDQRGACAGGGDLFRRRQPEGGLMLTQL